MLKLTQLQQDITIRFTKAGLFVFALLLLSINVRANSIKDTIRADSVYFRVDEQPSFPGGAGEFVKFLSKNIKYSKQMKLTQVRGKVIVQFIVEKDGMLTNIKAIKGPGGGTSEEAVRVMQKSPKWKPGIKDGKPVRVQYAAPLIFVFKPDEPKNEDGPLTLHNN
jgi:protein TonB